MARLEVTNFGQAVGGLKIKCVISTARRRVHGYLEFEFTETALMQDPQSTIAVLRALKDMGKTLHLAAW
jgi:EAL domain-containing protein (putative c-di-GMP-specific phosphodiesterase class I)